MELEMETAKTNNGQEPNPFDRIGGDYVKLEKDKAKILILTNWKIEIIKKFKDEEASKLAGKDVLKEQDEFIADVLSEDGQPVNKTFTTTSYNAMKGLKAVFAKYWPNTGKPVCIRIKKIGEGRSTIYDIEEQLIPSK